MVCSPTALRFISERQNTPRLNLCTSVQVSHSADTPVLLLLPPSPLCDITCMKYCTFPLQLQLASKLQSINIMAVTSVHHCCRQVDNCEWRKSNVWALPLSDLDRDQIRIRCHSGYSLLLIAWLCWSSTKSSPQNTLHSTLVLIDTLSSRNEIQYYVFKHNRQYLSINPHTFEYIWRSLCKRCSNAESSCKKKTSHPHQQRDLRRFTRVNGRTHGSPALQLDDRSYSPLLPLHLNAKHKSF